MRKDLQLAGPAKTSHQPDADYGPAVKGVDAEVLQEFMADTQSRGIDHRYPSCPPESLGLESWNC
ncbi:MAG: hypothetical protein OXI38_10970 [Bacteroidota bacterium]|nr:hypothetical protein [Bacteroidota bacterium]